MHIINELMNNSDDSPGPGEEEAADVVDVVRRIQVPSVAYVTR